MHRRCSKRTCKATLAEHTEFVWERKHEKREREQPQRVNSARERQREREKENIINLFKHGEIIMKEKQISFIHCDFIVCKHGRLFVVVAKSNKTEWCVVSFFSLFCITGRICNFLFLLPYLNVNWYFIFSSVYRVYIVDLSCVKLFAQWHFDWLYGLVCLFAWKRTDLRFYVCTTKPIGVIFVGVLLWFG